MMICEECEVNDVSFTCECCNSELCNDHKYELCNEIEKDLCEQCYYELEDYIPQ